MYLAGTAASRLRKHDRALAQARDALEAKTAELVEANRTLRTLEEQKSRFLGLAAHQLRGALAATEGCLVCVADGYATTPEKQAELVQRARNRVRGMLEITRDLLALSSAHGLAASAKKAPVALDEIAERVVDKHVEFAASKQVELVFHPGAADATVLGDERALAEALGNLVSNAIKYADEGGHVKVATRLARGEAVCEVIDDGIGIPEAAKERLFSEFYRAPNAVAGGREGTGLGLSIVKEIVERHGGRVKLESLEKLGTCAVVHLPVVREPRA